MKTAIVLGTFDGLHAGHRAVIEKAMGFYSVAVTFDIPPKSHFTFEPQLLMQTASRIERLKTLGIDRVDVQRFADVKNIAALDYLFELKQKYNPHRIVCGFNYRFGKDASGDIALISEFCAENNIEFICVEPIKEDKTVLSSTLLRGFLREGKVDKAATKIFGGFSFTAPVIHGDARGRTLGFPTANQEYPKEMVIPKFGVYISRVMIDGKKYDAITNVGMRPTYKTDTIGCETYIKDFSSVFYGKEITTELLRFVREEKKFSSAEELKNAILNDVKLIKTGGRQ